MFYVSKIIIFKTFSEHKIIFYIDLGVTNISILSNVLIFINTCYYLSEEVRLLLIVVSSI